MKNLVTALLFMFVFFAFAQDQTKFSNKALSDELLTLEGETITFSEIMKQYKGKKVVLEVWASWCSDCIKGMPKLNELQGKYTDDVVYLFLSLDKTPKSWKKGIEKYKVQGEHYYLKSGWKGDFCKSIALDWIPRYMVVSPNGSINLFKATVATDEKFEAAIRN